MVTNAKPEKVHVPFIRIAARKPMPFYYGWMVRLLGVLAGLIVSSVVIVLFTGLNPLNVYKTMIESNFGVAGLDVSRRLGTIWPIIRDTMILLLVALALAPVFKMRFWNIGGEGQILVGGLATAAVMKLLCNSMSSGMLYITMIAAAMLAGMLWGLLPAICKARWNTNETLFTLMMNYIAIQLISAFSIIWEQKKGSGSIGMINLKTKIGWLPTDWFESFAGTKNYMPNVIIILALAIIVFVYLRYTKHGYEIAVVGESENTARYAGISVKKVIIRTMLISGALCGLAGFFLVAGSSHTISVTTSGGRGFTAIIVAWLGKFNSFYMLIISYFLTFMEYGGRGVAKVCGLNANFSDIITGILLFFILGCEFFIRYRLIFRFSKKEVM